MSDTTDRVYTQESDWYVKYNGRGSEKDHGECAEIVKTFLGKAEYYFTTVAKKRLQYTHMANVNYMKSIVKYIKSLGFKVEYDRSGKFYNGSINQDGEPGYRFKIYTNVENGDVILGAHSLIRMIYSDRFDAIWDKVFELREMEELSNLDNWEILQLALYTNGEDEEYTYGNSLVKGPNVIFKISPLEAFKLKVFSKDGLFNTLTDRTTIYIDSNVSVIRNKINDLAQKNEYLQIYNTMKVTENDYTIAKCIDDEGKEDYIMINKIYKKSTDIKNKRLILIRCDDGTNRRFNKKRFKLY